MYSSTLRRTAGGIFGDERIRLMTLAEGPTLLSRLSTTQAVARHTPRTAACLAVVSYPAATKALRISASFAAFRALGIVFDSVAFHCFPVNQSNEIRARSSRSQASLCSF